MKKRKLLSILLLLLMSFQTAHAYVIDVLDTHSCEVSEYVDEFSPSLDVEMSDDICDIHAFFHSPFITSDGIALSRELTLHDAPQAFIKSYDYNPTKNFLIPPKQI